MSVGGNSISARPGSIYTVTHLKKIYLRSKSAQQYVAGHVKSKFALSRYAIINSM